MLDSRSELCASSCGRGNLHIVVHIEGILEGLFGQLSSAESIQYGLAKRPTQFIVEEAASSVNERTTARAMLCIVAAPVYVAFSVYDAVDCLILGVRMTPFDCFATFSAQQNGNNHLDLGACK